ncbi:hypothetical protein MTR67_017509 [Solanum verrucosum]|uniref:Integrase catalytic domain-containing protein n=1 Tax=Solanum verrucosum TaxID=315347 RepID=A0AAF0QQF1_SOLVR|nr:hypothetical protein MTR67_017509 [Solanum verrucosum]
MTKSAHFLPVKTTFSAEDYVKLYIQDVKGLGQKVNLSTAFHPQTDGQAECTIQTLGDMLRACVIDFKGNWIITYLTSSLLTTVTTLTSKWLPMRPFMGEDVDLPLDFLRLVKVGLWDQTWFIKLWRK